MAYVPAMAALNSATGGDGGTLLPGLQLPALLPNPTYLKRSFGGDAVPWGYQLQMQAGARAVQIAPGLFTEGANNANTLYEFVVYEGSFAEPNKWSSVQPSALPILSSLCAYPLLIPLSLSNTGNLFVQVRTAAAKYPIAANTEISFTVALFTP